MTAPKRLVIAGLVATTSIAFGETARALADGAHRRHGAQDAGGATRALSNHPAPNEQAKRGESTYLDECARCHSETLGGTEFGPALVGRDFVRAWAGKSVGDLFARVRDTMPADGPGRLAAQPSVDVVAFILHENTVDVGSQPLPAEAAALTRIIINPPPGR